MLDKLWTEFDALPFPDRVPREIRDGFDLELLDAEAAGCIQAFLATAVLDAKQVGILRACHTELRGLLPHLHGEALEYFRRLEHLCALVLNRVDSTRPAV